MPHATAPHRITIGDKVAFLCSTANYPARPQRVTVIETHMSWVFLAGDRVYKLKKPVRYDFLDFSTLAARRRNCEREIALNRRLAAAVYRAAVPLTLERDGQLRLNGKGRVIDWLVAMRRLPAQRMLDNALAAGSVTEEDTQRLARVLAAFYRTARPAPVAAKRYRRNFAAAIDVNRAQLATPAYGLPVRLIDRVTAAQRDFVARHGDLIAARAPHVVDAHGDLRPEHVCLTPRPVIIDCLEFRREYRLLDPADELAYFAMECARLGNAAVGETVVRQVLNALHDTPGAGVIAFYKCFRATVRAKIAIWHLADRNINHAAHWRRRARDYLGMAHRHAGELT